MKKRHPVFRKPRAGSLITQLTPEQVVWLRSLLEKMSYKEAAKVLYQKLGIVAGLCSLGNFYHSKYLSAPENPSIDPSPVIGHPVPVFLVPQFPVDSVAFWEACCRYADFLKSRGYCASDQRRFLVNSLASVFPPKSRTSLYHKIRRRLNAWRTYGRQGLIDKRSSRSGNFRNPNSIAMLLTQTLVSNENSPTQN